MNIYKTLAQTPPTAITTHAQPPYPKLDLETYGYTCALSGEKFLVMSPGSLVVRINGPDNTQHWFKMEEYFLYWATHAKVIDNPILITMVPSDNSLEPPSVSNNLTGYCKTTHGTWQLLPLNLKFNKERIDFQLLEQGVVFGCYPLINSNHQMRGGVLKTPMMSVAPTALGSTYEGRRAQYQPNCSLKFANGDQFTGTWNPFQRLFEEEEIRTALDAKSAPDMFSHTFE